MTNYALKSGTKNYAPRAARIEATHAGFQAGNDVALAVPRLGGMGKACEGPHLLGPGLGSAQLEIVGHGRRRGVEPSVARQTEDVTGAVVLAPGHGFRPAMVGVSPEDDPGTRPTRITLVNTLAIPGPSTHSRVEVHVDPAGIECYAEILEPMMA